MDKLKQIDKKWWITLAAVIIVIGGFFFWNSHKKYNASKDLDVTFSGYNGSGDASYNSTEIYEKMFDFVGKREGLKDDDLDRIKAASDISMDTLPDIYAKASKTKDLVSMVDVSLSKSSGLSNGDKVTVSVTTRSKNVPVKEIKKTFKVEGLKKTKSLTAGKVQDKLKISFKGINGAGQLQAKSKKYDDMVLKVKRNGKLSNGDTAKVTIAKSSLDNLTYDGIKYTGKRTFEVKVDGLTDVSKVSNVADVRNLNNEYANNENKSDEFNNYKVELIHTYIKADTDYDEDVSSEVSVNQSSDVSDKFQVFGLYKVTLSYPDMDMDPEVTYHTYGYSGLSIEDNKFNISDKNTEDDGITDSYDDSLAIIQQDLGSSAIIADK